MAAETPLFLSQKNSMLLQRVETLTSQLEKIRKERDEERLNNIVNIEYHSKSFAEYEARIAASSHNHAVELAEKDSTIESLRQQLDEVKSSWEKKYNDLLEEKQEMEDDLNVQLKKALSYATQEQYIAQIQELSQGIINMREQHESSLAMYRRQTLLQLKLQEAELKRTLKTERQELRRQVLSSVGSEVNDLTSENKRLGDELVQHAAETKNLSSERAGMAQMINDLKIEIGILKENEIIWSERNLEKDQRIRDLEHALSTLREEDVSSGRAELRQRIQSLESKVQQYEKTIVGLRKELESSHAVQFVQERNLVESRRANSKNNVILDKFILDTLLQYSADRNPSVSGLSALDAKKSAASSMFGGKTSVGDDLNAFFKSPAISSSRASSSSSASPIVSLSYDTLDPRRRVTDTSEFVFPIGGRSIRKTNSRPRTSGSAVSSPMSNTSKGRVRSSSPTSLTQRPTSVSNAISKGPESLFPRDLDPSGNNTIAPFAGLADQDNRSSSASSSASVELFIPETLSWEQRDVVLRALCRKLYGSEPYMLTSIMKDRESSARERDLKFGSESTGIHSRPQSSFLTYRPSSSSSTFKHISSSSGDIKSSSLKLSISTPGGFRH